MKKMIFTAMMLLCISSTAFAQSGSYGDHITWELDDSGTLSIKGTGKMDSAETYPWLEGDNKEKIKNLVIQDGIEGIGELAFQRCKQLQTVEIPESITEIGEGIFSGDESLINVVLPIKITKIPRLCFFANYNLRYVYIPENVTEIDSEAFANCEKLDEVTLPTSLKIISDGAFLNCLSLKTIKIPNSVRVINTSTFFSCRNLHNIELPRSLVSIENMAFLACESLEEIYLPEKVKKIESQAFSMCDNLKKIYIPKSVTKIASDAFDSDTSHVVIYGFADSFAEKFAKEKGIEFVRVTESLYHEPDYSVSVSLSPVKLPILSVSLNGGIINISLDGKNINFKDDLPFVDENNRTLIPVLSLTVDDGFTVTDSEELSEVTIEKNKMHIILKYNEEELLINDRYYQMVTSTKIIDGKTYVPIRYIAEVLGYEVVFN